jgi:hypothetical protein
MRLRLLTCRTAACVLTLWTIALVFAVPQAWVQSPGAGKAAKPPYNIIFVISDQEAANCSD